MPTEIERKFLIKDISAVPSGEESSFAQGYLQDAPERTVRVRVTDDRAYLTIKGISVNFSRSEYEYEIPYSEGIELLELSITAPIKKVRRVVIHKSKVWEIDIFEGDNRGLIVAEIELNSEEESFDIPHWVDTEVTSESRYYNSQLALHPYSRWEETPE